MQRTRLCVLLCCASVMSGAACAQNLLTNGSFEVSGPPNGQYLLLSADSTNIPGWKIIKNAEYLVPSKYHNWGVAAEGDSVLDISYSQNCGAMQTFPTQVGSNYTATFWTATIKSLGRDGTASFDASVGGVTTNVSIRTELPYASWSWHSIGFVATGATETISITTTNADANQFALLDDVGVFLVVTNAIEAPPLGISWEYYAGITITGNVGHYYRIDYSDDQSLNHWEPLAFITLQSSPCMFFDREVPKSRKRFYRIEEVPSL